MESIRLIDIANAAGVSKVTASKVLNPSLKNNTKVSDATRKRILEVAERLGYRVNLAASQLAGGKSRLLGILIDAHSSPMEFSRVSFVEEEAARAGYRFMVGQCKGSLENIRAYIDDFAGRGIEGVIIHSNSFPDFNKAIIEYARSLKHVVYYDRPLCDDGNCDFVEVDLAAGMRLLVDHLVANGRKKIVYFLPYQKFPFGKYPSCLARERGFIEGMNSHGLTYDPHFMERFLFDVIPPCRELVAIAKQFLSETRPDAVIARNDAIAGVLLRAMQELKISCPGEIALAGYDNMEFGQILTPALTTVDNRLPEVSARAAGILLDRIDGRISPEPVREYFMPKLIVRESTL